MKVIYQNDESTMEKEHKLESGHLIVCRNCGEIAAQILYTGTFYKTEPAPPKAESLNVAAIDAAIKEAIHVVQDTSAGLKAVAAPTIKFDGTDLLETYRNAPGVIEKEVRGEEINPKTGVRDGKKKQAVRPGDKGWLETQILSLMAFNPEMSGKEIIERTGGKQSTVYAIMRRIKNQVQTVAPDAPTIPEPVEDEGMVDFGDLMNFYGGHWGETQS